MATRGVIALAVLTAAVLASCAGDQYHFISSSSTGTYFKIPSSWRVFSKTQLLQAAGLPTSGGTDRFLVAFDASPHPSTNDDFSSNYPFGIARVRTLSGEEQDEYSFANLRNEIIQVDSIVNQDPNAVQVVSQPTLLTHGGLRVCA